MRREPPGAASRDEPRISVVVLTYNCADWVARTLDRHLALDGAPPVIVVDNASTDGTVEVAGRYPGVDLVSLPRNIGAAARNIGALRARTPYVAFGDDDTWYEPDAPSRMADLFDEHPRLAVVTARILVGEDCAEDPVCEEMGESPLAPADGVPGHTLLSFLAGVSGVRRAAFLGAGGYDPRLFIGGEEELLGLDLVRAGWLMRFIPEVVAHHHPSQRNAESIRHIGLRNTLWCAWLRRHWPEAIRWTAHVLRQAPTNRQTLRGLAMALSGLPWVLRERRVVTPELEAQLRLLDVQRMRSVARCYRPSKPGTTAPARADAAPVVTR
jgi:N-acetylglucosaminyl-diphospho-decaprenol L-rhamnosyltransferase